MANLRLNFDRKGVNEALSQPGVERELQRIAADVERTARSMAPIDTGDYRDGIDSDVDKSWVRPRGRVTAHSRHSLAVETRTGNLARALSSEAW